jgi:hypothetical protein
MSSPPFHMQADGAGRVCPHSGFVWGPARLAKILPPAWQLFIEAKFLATLLGLLPAVQLAVYVKKRTWLASHRWLHLQVRPVG